MKRPDFYKGSMLHPPTFRGLPQETQTQRFTFYIEPILTSVLKTDNYTISYLLVNANQDGFGGCGLDGLGKCSIQF